VALNPVGGFPSPKHASSRRRLACDGKTVRGTLSPPAPDQRELRRWWRSRRRESCIVLAQHAVPDQGHEMTLEATLVTPTQVQGRIVTADALQTQSTWCADMHRFGGYDVLQASANQPPLAEDGRRFFTEPPLDCRAWRQARPWSKGHGRLERRELVASTDLNEWLAATWPGVEQVVCV
jgi:hypothetical protein